MGRHCWLPLALLYVTVGATDAQAQNILVNPSFELGPVTSTEEPFLLLDPPSDAIPGWSVTRDQIKYVGPQWLAFDGTRSIDLDGNPGFGGVSQTFDSVPGTTYRLEFRMAGNPNPALWPPQIKRLEVTAAGQSSQFLFNITGRTSNSMGWIRKRWGFPAVGTTTTLEFRSLDALGGNGGAVIDDVVLLSVGTGFLRGDSDGDGELAQNDAIHTLTYLFFGSVSVDCPDAADINDDGNVDLSDAVVSVGYLFMGSLPPAEPFPSCGSDATIDAYLDCQYPLASCFD
jgi:choice-of-anchor C domain-containing protein